MELRIKPETLHKRITHLLDSTIVGDAKRKNLYRILNAIEACDGSPVLLNSEDIQDIFVVKYVRPHAFAEGLPVEVKVPNSIVPGTEEYETSLISANDVDAPTWIKLSKEDILKALAS